MLGTMTGSEQIGQYALVESLGRGATAEVWRARHVMLGSHHAVKVLAASSPEMAARLLREGRVQASLRHPNIVPVTDLVQDGGRIALVMELVRGGSLMDRLQLRRRLTAAEVMALLEALLDGLNHAHRAGVLHRDLKLANVLLDDDTPRIADFGLARLSSGSAGPGMTRSGQPMGTPGYMPPEQWADAASIDARADIFALGVIAYELLTGSSPFTGPTPTAILNATVAGRRRDVRALCPDCPEPLAAAIDGALQPDRELRLAGCREMAAALGILLPERALPELPEEDELTPLPAARPTAVPAPATVQSPLYTETLVAPDLSIDEGPGVLGLTAGDAAAATVAPDATPSTSALRGSQPTRWAAVGAGVLAGLALATWWLAAPDVEAPADDGAAETIEVPEDGSAEAGIADAPSCAGGGDELLGYWFPGRRFRAQAGDVVTVSVLTHVREDYPRPGNSWASDAPIRCALQPGQQVELREDPKASRNRRVWVPLYGGDLR